MSELRPCPFCGKPPAVGLNGYPRCPIPGIGTHAGGMTVDEWNARPLEDALQKRVEELEKLSNAHKKLACLVDQQQIDLRASISKAVEEIGEETDMLLSSARKEIEGENNLLQITSIYGKRTGLMYAIDIIRKHGLIGDNK